MPYNFALNSCWSPERDDYEDCDEEEEVWTKEDWEAYEADLAHDDI